MAGDDPLPGFRHGQWGYQKYGCRCFVCRRGKADAQARFRAKRQGVAYQAPSKNTMEILTRAEIMALGVLSDAAVSTAHMAIITARLIDQIQEQGTWHLLNPTTKRYGELMKELRACNAGGEDGPDEFLDSIRRLGLPD